MERRVLPGAAAPRPSEQAVIGIRKLTEMVAGKLKDSVAMIDLIANRLKGGGQ
jgi:hypothetical protein